MVAHNNIIYMPEVKSHANTERDQRLTSWDLQAAAHPALRAGHHGLYLLAGAFPGVARLNYTNPAGVRPTAQILPMFQPFVVPVARKAGKIQEVSNIQNTNSPTGTEREDDRVVRQRRRPE